VLSAVERKVHGLFLSNNTEEKGLIVNMFTACKISAYVLGQLGKNCYRQLSEVLLPFIASIQNTFCAHFGE
jgi:hypothetical protein